MSNLMVGIGSIAILISTWIFGGMFGIFLGFLLLLVGAFSDQRKFNYTLFGFGAGVTFFSVFLIGGPIGVTIGLILMLSGIYIPALF